MIKLFKINLQLAEMNVYFLNFLHFLYIFIKNFKLDNMNSLFQISNFKQYFKDNTKNYK